MKYLLRAAFVPLFLPLYLLALSRNLNRRFKLRFFKGFREPFTYATVLGAVEGALTGSRSSVLKEELWGLLYKSALNSEGWAPEVPTGDWDDKKLVEQHARKDFIAENSPELTNLYRATFYLLARDTVASPVPSWVKSAKPFTRYPLSPITFYREMVWLVPEQYPVPFSSKEGRITQRMSLWRRTVGNMFSEWATETAAKIAEEKIQSMSAANAVDDSTSADIECLEEFKDSWWMSSWWVREIGFSSGIGSADQITQFADKIIQIDNGLFDLFMAWLFVRGLFESPDGLEDIQRTMGWHVIR